MLIFVLCAATSTAHAEDTAESGTKAPLTDDSTETKTAEPAADEPAADEPVEATALETLRLARLRFERGEYEKSVEAFSSILSSPVALKTRRELHEGFLYFAFTLLLQDKTELAIEKLEIALRLDPEFAPSPVTTRPDLLAFYEARQRAFVAVQGGVAEAPEAVFPELAGDPGSTVVLRRQRFVPVLGIGLRQLGHSHLGNALLGTEVTAFSINIASLIVRAAYISDRTPKGMTATSISREVNYTTFGIFWGALLADFILSMSLRRFYKRNPEKRRGGGTLASRYSDRRPRLQSGGTSLTLSFW